MATTLLLTTVTDAQLAKYAKVIYEKAGIHVSDQKKTLLSNRIRRRLKATGIDCFDAYLKHLKSLPPTHTEWSFFLEEVTTHESYLFRDESHWKWLRTKFIPELIVGAKEGKPRRLRIWSAACSTGDEPFTIACCLANDIRDHESWQIEIVGTDIGVDTLAKARDGIFNERAMRNVPESMKKRFFTHDAKADQWSARPQLRQWMKFQKHNLLNRLTADPFDLVFVKNVLIYFDAASKKTAMEHIKAAIRPGGMLVTGPAEGVNDMLTDFQRVEGWLHRKPEQGK